MYVYIHSFNKSLLTTYGFPGLLVSVLKIAAFYTTVYWMNVSVDRSTTGMYHLKIHLCLIIRISESSPKCTGAAGSLKFEVRLTIYRWVVTVSSALFNAIVHFEQPVCVFCVILLIYSHCLLWINFVFCNKIELPPLCCTNCIFK
jgi:hypothetical protein